MAGSGSAYVVLPMMTSLVASSLVVQRMSNVLPPVFTAVTPEMTGAVVSTVPLLTLTLIVLDVPLLPAASYALELSECDPFATAVVSQENEYGALLSVAARTPST